MLKTAIIFLATALLSSSQSEAKSFSISSATASRAALPLAVSSNILTLTRKQSSKGYNSRSAAYLLGLATIPPSTHSSTLISLFIGEEFATEITFGTETFESIVDTGSSDTWIIESGFKCVNISNSAPETEAFCNFGPTYNVTDTFVQIPDENFNITYGDGEFLTGIIGTEEVTLAGITVEQTVALVNYAAWDGDGTTSGLIGLAYPALYGFHFNFEILTDFHRTSAYAGTDPTLDNSPAGEQIVYSPIFHTMVTDGLVPDLFSLAILRDISGPSGYLSLGGLPPLTFNGTFTSTPILITHIDHYPVTYDFYTINVDSILLHGKPLPGSGGPSIQYIVDSGTTLNYFPTSVADAFNAAFDPPAVYSEDDGVYYVDCNAKKPALDILIAGTRFDTNPLDLILLAGTDENGNDICISGVDDGGSDPTEDVYILGDTFQKNVISVFDIGAAEMRFAAREHYPSNDPYKA